MQKSFFLIAILVVALQSCGQDKKLEPISKTFSIQLGDSIIEIVTSQYGDRKDVVMVNLHSDETTSVLAAQKVLADSGGLLIKIENRDKRLIQFTNQGRNYKFDPNRMFTDDGTRASLAKFASAPDEYGLNAVRQLRELIWKVIPDSLGAVIALHNNDEGNLSILSYYRGAANGVDTRSISKNDSQDIDNFFFVTDDSLFRQLTHAGFNVVLQDNEKVRDDGSLSVYYGRKNRSYVNVEAQAGQTEEQERMIRVLLSKIK